MFQLLLQISPKSGYTPCESQKFTDRSFIAFASYCCIFRLICQMFMSEQQLTFWCFFAYNKLKHY